ncbi:hypothetical protein Scep_024086 [Stephania cephalantha]|uniref:Uncharacterized protein n=1 Tax=Stephania cephalantha TaxID=152367 RepID=A0AAP0EVW9_9MAGN
MSLPSSPPLSASSSARSHRRRQNHHFPLHIASLVLSPLPVDAVKVIAFLYTIFVLPHTYGFSVSVSVSAFIEDFDVETIAGECDHSNCSHRCHRFNPPSSLGAVVDVALTPPRYVLKGFGGGGGGGSEGDHPNYSKSFVIGSALFNIFVGLKLRSFSPKFLIVGEIQEVVEDALPQRELEDHREVEAHSEGFVLHQEIEDHYEGVGRDPSFLALDRDEDDEITPNDVFLHVHTKDHDGVTFIDNRSARFHADLMRRREEHTQATPDRPIDEKQIYYDVAGVCSKGRVYGLGSLANKKRRYEDHGASTSQEPMVRHIELDAVVQRLAQFEAFVQSHLGMRMDFGASTFQAPPPPLPPPQKHHQQVGMDSARSPQQQHDNDDEDNHD